MFIINSLIIDQHYCGPSESGNGGYSAGLVAANVPFPAEVTLRKRPPLNKPMRLIVDNGTAQLLDGDVLIAEAKKQENFELEIPPVVDLKAAQEASKHYYGFEFAPFPNCFVCGHLRRYGEGLKIHAGRVVPGVVASPWVPYPNLAGKNGVVKTAYIWAALDCPGAWALLDHEEVVVLGRIAVKQVRPVRAEEPYVVMGWVIGREGRKTWTGTAVFNENKEVCAYAKATWITIQTAITPS
ncbi:MAG TPA: hypothetical protein ENJ20_05225 [Bacteroidetes bacterium]|nr:hypothetical protein [Bacteroidota bacterium]